VAAPASRTSTVVIAALALLITFAAGVVVGVVGDRFLFLHHGPRRMPPMAVDAMISRLDHQLDLSAGQRAEVEKILERRHQRIMALTEDLRPRIAAEIEGANADIERVLTPEQRAKFQDVKIRLSPMMHHEGRGRRGPTR
jgi:hypothetical protein